EVGQRAYLDLSLAARVGFLGDKPGIAKQDLLLEIRNSGLTPADNVVVKHCLHVFEISGGKTTKHLCRPGISRLHQLGKDSLETISGHNVTQGGLERVFAGASSIIFHAIAEYTEGFNPGVTRKCELVR